MAAIGIFKKVRNIFPSWDFSTTTTVAQQESQHKAYQMPIQFQRAIVNDVAARREAINLAERKILPFRYLLQRMYMNTRENPHIKACIDRRKDLTLLRKWQFKNADDSVNDKVCEIFLDKNGNLKTWFSKFLSFALDAEYYGYSLVWLGDVVDGDFPNIQVVPRWNVSPERKVISTIPQSPNGVRFEVDEEFKDYYLFIDTPNELGTQECGMGLFYELSVLEMFARNLLGFNANYVETSVAPFRHMKTSKTNEDERGQAELIMQTMGNSGYAITDFNDEIEFINASGGTTYQAFDLMEKRLYNDMSKAILGHENALIAKPSALGGGEESPEMQAMEDKQTKDGAMITAVVNGMLFERMRALGFNIPDGVTGIMLNDNEEVENANNIAELAIKIKNAGLQMDGKYFTEKTNIPLAEIVAPLPNRQLNEKVQNKLRSFYNKIECNH